MRLACGAVILRIPAVELTEEQRGYWERWIQALESGDFKQTTHCLRDDTGFCCLGLASHLTDSKGWHREHGAAAFSFRPSSEPSGAETSRDHLIPSVRKRYGEQLGPLGINVGGRFPDGLGTTLELGSFALGGINDMGATFEEIAQILRHAISGGYTCTTVSAVDTY